MEKQGHLWELGASKYLVHNSYDVVLEKIVFSYGYSNKFQA